MPQPSGDTLIVLCPHFDCTGVGPESPPPDRDAGTAGVMSQAPNMGTHERAEPWSEDAPDDGD